VVFEQPFEIGSRTDLIAAGTPLDQRRAAEEHSICRAAEPEIVLSAALKRHSWMPSGSKRSFPLPKVSLLQNT
jgi:hypothetical protein